MKKIIALSLVLAMTLGMMAGCGSSADNSANSAPAAESSATAAAEETQAEAGGKLVMATNANFPPYEYMEGDAYEGIDVEIAGEIAKKLGKELEIQNVAFGSIIAGVQSGKYDMGMAGMTVTDERKQSVNFTDVYAHAVQVVIVKEDSAIASVDDITSDNKIGVQQDTTGDIYASGAPEDGGYGEDAVVRYTNGADAVQALLTGKVDCVIIDSEPAKNFVAANEGLKILDSSYADEDYAICVAKENEELLGQINTALAELTEDGTIAAIVEKYIPSEE